MTHSITTQHNSKHPAMFRISRKSMVAVITFAALVCALIMQHFELVKTQSSLARYETSLIPTALEPIEFRVIVNKVLQTDHATVIGYQIEKSGDHSATIASGGDSNGSRATYNPKTNLHGTESVLLVDHIKSENVLKVMPKVSEAQGYSVASVADDFSLADAITVHDPEMVHSRRDTATLVEIEGWVYTLTLKT